MKKIVLILLACLSITMVASAKSADDSKYLRGAVPEENGIIVFRKGFRVTSKNQQQIYDVLKAWTQSMVDKSISAPGPYARLQQDSSDTIAARVVEWMTFKDKFLNLDQARFRYQIAFFIKDGCVDIAITGLAYHYGADIQTEQGGEFYRAEDWISDAQAVNKAGTKLYPKSAKFRRKTVDRMEAIFDEIMDLFTEKEPPVVETKKVRKGVEED